MSAFRKIVWAVDVLEEPSLQERAAEALRVMARTRRIEVEAVYLPILAHLRLPALDFSGPWLEEYRLQTETSLTGILDRHGLGGMGRATMLERNFASNLDAVRALAEYARAEGASLILASTHGRSGLGRLFLGSFTETLLQYSEFPVMTVGPHARGPLEFGSVLFPTDFGREARSVYRQAVGLCSELKARLLLYHALHPSLQQFMQSESYVLTGTWMPAAMPAAVEADDGRPQAERRARRWTSWARARGVDTRYVLEEGVGSVADAILANARKRHAGLIVIGAESGPVATLLLGSVTRHVVRHAECPIIVMRPFKRAVQLDSAEKAA
ncbi:MAG: universal stress protein [Oligoflexia bacterium]|nr:universal stress protein [Oligoflexia bacterium]